MSLAPFRARLRAVYKAWLDDEGGSAATARPSASDSAGREVPSDYKISDEPLLVPPPSLMRTEGIDVIETWFRWAEEWSVILRVYGGVGVTSDVMEIGCGLGRIAFPLRYVLLDGTYAGFDISREKIDFLNRTFHATRPNFSFAWADLYNSYYNPDGKIAPEDFAFPYEDGSFDVVFAASIFTHLLPSDAEHYLHEIARVLRPSGISVISAFLLDHFLVGRTRPLAFNDSLFDLVHEFGEYGADFAVSRPAVPETVTGYRLRLLENYANGAGLVRDGPALIGMWSGCSESWVGAQDVVVLRKVE